MRSRSSSAVGTLRVEVLFLPSLQVPTHAHSSKGQSNRCEGKYPHFFADCETLLLTISILEFDQVAAENCLA